MGLFDFLQPKKKDVQISSILPQEIYDAGALELKTSSHFPRAFL
jgi:hypothetical protein